MVLQEKIHIGVKKKIIIIIINKSTNGTSSGKKIHNGVKITK